MRKFAAILSITLLLLLTVTTVAAPPERMREYNVEPIFVWVYLQDSELHPGRSTRAYANVINPSPDAQRYTLSLQLTNYNGAKQELFKTTFIVPPFEEVTINGQLTPPSVGSWDIILLGTVVETGFSRENIAHLEVCYGCGSSRKIK